MSGGVDLQLCGCDVQIRGDGPHVVMTLRDMMETDCRGWLDRLCSPCSAGELRKLADTAAALYGASVSASLGIDFVTSSQALLGSYAQMFLRDGVMRLVIHAAGYPSRPGEVHPKPDFDLICTGDTPAQLRAIADALDAIFVREATP